MGITTDINTGSGIACNATTENMSCIVCNSADTELIFKGIKDFEYETYKPVDYSICKNCGMISQNPLPSPDLIGAFYPGEYRNYLPVKKTFYSSIKNIQFQTLANKITRHINRDKKIKILEIGFGNGQLLLTLKEQGYKNLYGNDFTDRFFSVLKEKGINLKVSNIEKGFPFSEIFDVIIMNNVIEHFLDPITVLKNCKKNLARNGKIVLITPNSNALEFLFFKKYWAGFHAPRHTFLFNDKNLKLLGKNLEFAKVKTEPFIDSGQLSISVQNLFQDNSFTKVKLKNGMAWYLIPLTLILSPMSAFQNLIGRSTSMICILES